MIQTAKKEAAPQTLSMPERLREFRESKGLSRAALASELGVSTITLYRWETGSTKPSPLAGDKLRELGFGALSEGETNIGSIPRLKLARLASKERLALGLSQTHNESPGASKDTIFKLIGFAETLVTSPFVRNGPPDQEAFHHKLINLQMPGLSTPPGKNIFRRLSLVQEVEGYGQTAQHQLEQPKTSALHWNSNYGSHGWHRYVGRFPPHVIRALLNHFGAHTNSLVCDPFAGSGTTAVECRLLGIPFVGIEICPLSCLMTRTKAQFPKNPRLLIDVAESFSDFYASRLKSILGKRPIETFSHNETLSRRGNLVPSFANLERWFTSEAFLGVSIVMEFAMSLEGYTRDAVLLALSSKMRSIGNVDVDVVRAEYSREPRQGVEVGRMVTQQLRKMSAGVALSLKTHSDLIGDSSIIDVKEGSVLDLELPENSVDCVITSPPYGVEALSYLRTHLLSYRSLVAHLKHDPYETRDKTIGSEYLDKVVPRGTPPAVEVSPACKKFFDLPHGEVNPKYVHRRAGMLQFFDDMLATGERISRWVKPGGNVAFIVGNKRLGDDVIPTDVIVRQIFESCGLGFVDSIQHKLKTNNSNSQVPWQERIIQEESILMFKKSGRPM
jgi:DNA-binding XRE family transcriptional regulator